MSRLAIVLVPLACLPLMAAPLTKDREKAAPFLMTKEGDTKVSEIAGNSVTEVTEVVTEVERKGETIRVTTRQQVHGGGHTDRTFEASDKGVFLVAVGGKDLPDPRPDLRLPAKAGDAWTWREEAPLFAPAKFTWTVGKWEEVDVPAGKFQALRVELELESGRPPARTGTYWYAPGLGVIKSVLNTSTGVQTTVLKSFKPGK
jgi:hypothetical protein